MDNFIQQILSEAKQVGTIYHFTGFENIISILTSNNLKPTLNEIKRQQVFGVSATRDKNFHISQGRCRR